MPDDDGIPGAPKESDAPRLRATYEQLCDSYRAIDDLRAKHLGFLPLVTGGGLILLIGRQEEFAREFFLPVGIFGLAVTVGLFSYEIFGMRRCHDLIYLGKCLEDRLNHPGQFTVRRRIVGGVINEPFAAGIIYPAVMAAWIYLALFYKARLLGMLISIAIFLLGFILTFRYDVRLGRYPDKPPPWYGQWVPSEPGFVLSPGGWTPPRGVLSAWNWQLPEGAKRRFDLVPLWARAWYYLPLIDGYARAWTWRHGGWEVRPPDSELGHTGHGLAASGD